MQGVLETVFTDTRVKMNTTALLGSLWIPDSDYSEGQKGAGARVGALAS
jgi:hypothetical protein